MNSMNKAGLVRSVAAKTGLTQSKANDALDAVLGSIQDTLEKGNDVVLIGFGTFSVKERSARTGRNPRTGEEISIPASRTVNLKPGKALKDAVNS